MYLTALLRKYYIGRLVSAPDLAAAIWLNCNKNSAVISCAAVVNLITTRTRRCPGLPRSIVTFTPARPALLSLALGVTEPFVDTRHTALHNDMFWEKE